MLGEGSHFSTQASVRNAFGDLGRRCCHQDRGHKHVTVPGQESQMGHEDQAGIGNELPLSWRGIKAVRRAGVGWTEGLPQTGSRHAASNKEARLVNHATATPLKADMLACAQGQIFGAGRRIAPSLAMVA